MQFLSAICFLVLIAGIVAVVGGCSRQEVAKTAKAPVAAEVLPAIVPVDASLVYDSEWNTAAFKTYARDGSTTARQMRKESLDGNPALIQLQSLNGAPMGANLKVDGLRGQVTFEYTILEAGAAAKFGMVAIPLTESDEKGPIEVGSDKPGDPKNVDSPHRIRFMVPPEHYADGKFHAATLNFDFTKLDGATSSVIAPRINEFSGAGTPGVMRLRHIQVRLK